MSKKSSIHLYSTEIIFCNIALILSAPTIEKLREAFLLMNPTIAFKELEVQKTSLSLIK